MSRFELPHANEKTKLIYEKLIQLQFRRNGWIYETGNIDPNEWAFLNEEEQASEMPLGILNKHNNGEEFFLLRLAYKLMTYLIINIKLSLT